jgi:predicted TIM-barrel fold metal-dependent hydrolase
MSSVQQTTCAAKGGRKVTIDFHAHVGDFRSRLSDQPRPVTFDGIVRRLDEEGIDAAVLLPVYASPEAIYPSFILEEHMSVRDQVLRAAQYRGRILPFGNLDPRWAGNSPNGDFSAYLDWFASQHCLGIGEITANMPLDDERVINLFRQIGVRGWPVVMHVTGFGLGSYGLQDEPGAPRLERLLRACPDTPIVGHGPGFWAEIGPLPEAAAKSGYPTGPISQEGALPRLLRECPNLYADISAHSGYNALTRDQGYGPQFLEEFQDRLLFGTDVCFSGEAGRMPHLGYLRRLLGEGSLSTEAFEKITGANAIRLLRLPA